MSAAEEMPLLEMLQVLSRTPVTEPQLRAVVAVTCARWCVARGEDGEAQRLLTHAIELVPDLRPAMRLLYRIFLRRGDIRNSVRYLDQEIRATRHPREAAALYRERGQLVEAHFGDRSAALQCYQAALKATPRDLAVLRSVEAVALSQGNIFSLIANLEAQLEVLHDASAVAAVARDLALLEARQGGDLNLACELMVAAVEEQRGNLSLLQDLFRLAEAAGNSELMLRALEFEADARPPELRAMPLTRASLVLREIRERAAAVSLLHAAAKGQPGNVSLWRNLEDLSMATARYDVAVEACAGQLKAIGSEDPAIQAELFYRLGKLAMIRLDRVTEGLGAMRKALKLFPGHIPALEDAGRYLIANDAWAQLLELLKLQVATADDAGLSPEEKAQAQLRAGQVLEERLGELEGARQIYEEAVVTCPSFRPALDRLERVQHQLGRIDGLRELYQGELARGAEGQRRVFLLSILARLHAQQGDANAAIKTLVSLLKDFPEHTPSIQLLARLLAKANRAKELLQVTEQEIKLTISPRRQTKLLYRSAELSLELGDGAHAEECLRQALETVSDHQPSMALLERILRDRGDTRGLIDLLRMRLEQAPDPEQRLSLHLEVALLQLALGDATAALAEVDPILATAPEHLTTLQLGARLASATGQPERHLRYLQLHFGVARGHRTRALLVYRTGLLRKDPRLGVTDLRRALALWPQLGGGHHVHLALAEATGDTALIRSAARSGLTDDRGAGNRQGFALRLAELSTSPGAALPYLQAAALARPQDLGNQIRLARAARFTNRPGLAAPALLAAATLLDNAAAGKPRGGAAPPQLPSGNSTVGPAPAPPPLPTSAASHPAVQSLRYRAARAHEQAGEYVEAERILNAILEQDREHAPALRARARITAEKAAPAACRAAATELVTAAGAETVPAEKAVLLTRAAELLQRAGDLSDARARLDAALVACPAYLPAMYLRTCLLEHVASTSADPGLHAPAVDALIQLAEALGPEPALAYPHLCRAGMLALRARDPARAWKALARALDLAPELPLAFSVLWRVREAHGRDGAVPLRAILERRLAALQTANKLGAADLRTLARVALDSDGPAPALALLERGLVHHPKDVGVLVDLARLYARLGRWNEAVQQVLAAAAEEPVPERKAMLQFFAADAQERSGSPEAAFDHYLAASRGGYHPHRSLTAADRIASALGTMEQRVEVLQLLIHQGDVDERVRSLRALAELNRGPLGKPERAAALLRELLKLRPASTEVILDLHDLLIDLGRADEGRVALHAGIAAQRTILRERGLSSTGESTSDPLDPQPVLGLLRLFDAAEEPGGVYVCAAILEAIDPDLVPANRRCDTVKPEPWPLPGAPEKPAPFFAADEVATGAALGLLRNGVHELNAIPGAPPPAVNLSQRHSLPATSSVGTVTRAIARTLGLPEPLLFLNQGDESSVIAHVGTAPVLLIGRKINAVPTSPTARDAIGRALLRLATGGDHLHRVMSNEQIMGVLHGLASCAGVELDKIIPIDDATSDTIIEALAGAGAHVDFGEDVETLSRTLPTFSILLLRDLLRTAEDRAGVIACGDPRVALLDRSRFPTLSTRRAAGLVAYLVSEEHLALRRALGYHVELELDLTDVEELPA
jgi:tetratricopeptide (TPR) repeat protein